MWQTWFCFPLIRDMNRAQPPTTHRETTYTDVGNADIAGANIRHPWWLNTRIRPPRTVEVQVLQEQKPAMRVMVVDKCVRFMFLAVNWTAVIKTIYFCFTPV